MTQEASPKPPEPTVTYVVKVGHASAPQTLEVHAAQGDIYAQLIGNRIGRRGNEAPPARLVAKKGTTLVPTAAGLKGKRIGVQRSTIHDRFVTDTFKDSLFEHNNPDFSSYPLEGKHRPLACDRCHASEALRNGTSAVRWRLGYLQCKDCHANPHKEGS